MTDKRHTVNESADKIVLKAEVKRGDGTRDQDKIKVKVKGDDPAGTAARLEETLSRLKDTPDDLRAMRAGGDD
jgi:hypothetical protein